MAPSPDDSRIGRAIGAACAVAEEHGLLFTDAVVLNDQSNVMLHLRPAPVVARVATTTGTVRAGDAWLAREVAVARYLQAAAAPALRPSAEIDPGPHQRHGLALSFWEYVEILPGAADPAASGRALRQCHEALADFADALPELGALAEAEELLARLGAEALLAPADAELLQRTLARLRRRLSSMRLESQAVHGDAHLGNVFNSGRGPLWADWEDVFRGPRLWDLACLVASSRVFGSDVAAANQALTAYGLALDEELLDLFVEARTFQAAVWMVIIGREHPQRRDRLEGRLRWLRARERG